jgi:cytochrome b subunit of formate dehydrogenase
METFHGKVSRLGFEDAAKCADCHGSHNILASYMSGSALSTENRVDTCAQCHEGAHESFTSYLTHASHTDQKNYPQLYWAFVGMTALLLGTLAFFGLHSLLWMNRLWKTRNSWAPIKAQRREAKLYRRFSRLQRGLHTVMVLCFLTLALTGMALKFSHRPWAQVVAEFLGGFQFTGAFHRLAALGLIGVFCVHLWDVNRMRREQGRSWWSMVTGKGTIIFTLNDLKEFWQTVKWFFGKAERPRYGRWSYWEKFDYFAVLWGIAIIGSTGFLLWKPVFLTQWVPGWTVNVATIIHSDEALLASAFIFTIHFFNTQFRPDKFPLDPVVFTGRMSIEELKHEKPREYEQLVEDGRLDDVTVKPLKPAAENAIRAFAYSALVFGVLLVITIFSSLAAGH